MVKRIFLFMMIFLFASCDTKLYNLTMVKTPYIGDELRIDGYFYSSPMYEKDIGVAVFYKDGFCIHTWVTPKSQDTLNFVENDILLNEKYISGLKNSPSHIGVFRIINHDIEFEVWEYRNETVSHFGKVINDTIFIVNKRIEHRTNTVIPENRTYRFKQFSPKPDSTNVWIK